ncbi:MAG: GGDEF domain-containing protein [Gemmatimonadota bacterium]
MAIGVIGFAVGAALGGAAGWALARGRRGTAVAREVSTGLLPDPALRWLLRAHGGLGVWISELLAGEEGPSNERVVDAERLGVAQITAVDRRLERARDSDQGGAERMDGGTLVFRAGGGIAVALLLPDGHGPAQLAQAEDDLARLLEGVRRRPQIVALAQAHSDEASLETVGSVGLRLAYQLERITGSEVVVAAVETAGIKVVGASGRADRRLLDSYATPESPLARVARGESNRELADAEFMGGAGSDRRQRVQAILVIPVPGASEPIGAVALWLTEGREPPRAAMTEIEAAIANAAPRISRAVQADGLRQDANIDVLTGLYNRRYMESVLKRQDLSSTPATGALVYGDLDRFKVLNDTLGHPAGDAALVHFGRLVRDQIRSGDTGARMGGEEFGVWLPGAPLEVGARIAERLRVKLSTTPWDWQGRTWPLSASFGVSACPETSRRLENLPAQADSALYVAKNSGRNRVEVAARLPVLEKGS